MRAFHVHLPRVTDRLRREFEKSGSAPTWLDRGEMCILRRQFSPPFRVDLRWPQKKKTSRFRHLCSIVGRYRSREPYVIGRPLKMPKKKPGHSRISRCRGWQGGSLRRYDFLRDIYTRRLPLSTTYSYSITDFSPVDCSPWLKQSNPRYRPPPAPPTMRLVPGIDVKLL